MSAISDSEYFWLVTGDSHCRTVAEIERKVVHQGNRGSVERFLHTKNDKEKISAWKLELDRILRVFQVGSIIDLLILLTVYHQTELAINACLEISEVGQGVSDTHHIVSDTRAVVSDTHVIVSDTHAMLSDTHAVVSEIRHIIAKGQEVTDDSDRPVSNCRLLLVPV